MCRELPPLAVKLCLQWRALKRRDHTATHGKEMIKATSVSELRPLSSEWDQSSSHRSYNGRIKTQFPAQTPVVVCHHG